MIALRAAVLTDTAALVGCGDWLFRVKLKRQPTSFLDHDDDYISMPNPGQNAETVCQKARPNGNSSPVNLPSRVYLCIIPYIAHSPPTHDMLGYCLLHRPLDYLPSKDELEGCTVDHREIHQSFVSKLAVNPASWRLFPPTTGGSAGSLTDPSYLALALL
jgi:hypothetical protein